MSVVNIGCRGTLARPFRTNALSKPKGIARFGRKLIAMSSSPPLRRDRRSPERGALAARAIAAAVAVGFFAYCSLSALLGPSGLTAYKALEASKASMEANLERLSSINERLSGELESLISDPDRAAAEARSLGYLRKGETEVLVGGKKAGAPRIDIGEVLPYADPPALGDGVIKAISLGAAMTAMAALLAPGVLARRPRRYRDRLVHSASLE
jgi:cell division protein FtsB